ncbi:MAG: hypothetical protein GXN91_00865 [Epsilonproteobacteria bacterium]|nr:hypothetical protein [Campylobacterota bacterium]
MGCNNRSAVVQMEEEYMTLIIEYKDKEDRAVICDEIGKVEEEFGVHPEVMHKRNPNGGGSFTIEFADEIYVHSRIPGEFIEKVLNDLEIEQCDER